MNLHGTSKINSKGELEIGGCSIVGLAKKYGTPLWILDEELIRTNAGAFREAFKKRGNSQVLYASKAFLTTAMCKIIETEGLGLDVVSGGELFTAAAAGFPMDRVFFHGNNKSREELEFALEKKVARIIVDNFYEMELLNKIAEEKGMNQAILLRITPGVEAHTHDYIKTGQIDSKFGFALQNGQAQQAVLKALECDNLTLKGIHCHIGSQIFEINSYAHATEIMVDFMKTIESKTTKVFEELNLGGGLGICYTDEDKPSTIEDYAEIIMNTVKSKTKEVGYPLPKIMVEPGRSIVGPAGTSIYKVGSIKNIPKVRKYVSVDGGMYENLRPALYDSKYAVYLASNMKASNEEKVTITGKCCESGDILAWDVKLPILTPGDILAMTSTGAYGYSMSSNYNRIPKQAVVLVYKGISDIIVKRETYEDIIRNDVIPKRLL